MGRISSDHAGRLATAAGAAAAFFTRRTNTRMLSVALGLSGGVMVYISFVELLAGANLSLRRSSAAKPAPFCRWGRFSAACFWPASSTGLVPEPANPHETKSVEEMDKQNPPDYAKLHRAGIRFAAGDRNSQVPGRAAVFAASLSGLELGIPVALAMALHNIPEGIAVSVPVYYATGSRAKAFWYASLTGLADPAGALLGYLVLAPFLTSAVLEIIYAAVAGIMVFVTFDGLLPMGAQVRGRALSLYGSSPECS